MPHTYFYNSADGYCTKAGGEAYGIIDLWSNETNIYQPNPATLPVLSYVYKDPRIQYFLNKGTQVEKCGNSSIVTALYAKLLYYDNTLVEQNRTTLKKSMYYA